LTGKYQRGGKPSADTRAGSKKELYQWVSEEYAESNRNWRTIETVTRIENDIECTPAQVALSWLGNRPGVTAPIFGARTVDQLTENLGAVDVTLDDTVIGVSNFFPDRFVDLAENVAVKPAVNQMETHVFNQQIMTREVLTGYKTILESWGSFAGGKNNLFTNEVLKQIGDKYNKSVAQVALRFLVQQGIVALPKSTHKERIIENFNVFDFKLLQDELAVIATLDTKESLFLSHTDPASVKFILDYDKTMKP